MWTASGSAVECSKEHSGTAGGKRRLNHLLTLLSLFAISFLGGCGAGTPSGSSSSSSGSSVGSSSSDWYYHWNCNGDPECLVANPSTTNQTSGDEDIDVYANCASLMTFGEKFWDMPPATESCDQSSSANPPSSSAPSSPPTISSFTPTTSSPGGEITIVGTNFPSSASQITAAINGVQMIVVSVSSTQLLVSIPPMAAVTAPIIVTAPAGTATSTGSFAVTSTLFSVTWSGSQFVAVGYGASGIILTSPDGVTWTSQVSGTTKQLYGIASSSSQYVTVGDFGTILTSPNAISWTSRSLTSSNTSVTFIGATWSGTQFAAVGTGVTGTTILPVIYTSPDGISWTARNSGVNSAVALRNVVWSGTQFVTIGDNDTTLTSPDGVTWTNRTTGTTLLLGVCWSGTKFVTVGTSNTGFYSSILTSPDGVTWTSQTSGTTNTLSGVAWSGSKFVAVGGLETILSSPDGVNWTTRTP